MSFFAALNLVKFIAWVSLSFRPTSRRLLFGVSLLLYVSINCKTLNSSSLLRTPTSISFFNSFPTAAYEIFDGATGFGGGFVGAGGVFAGSATSSFFGVLDLVFALGGGAGAASNTISCLGADFGLDADLALGADSKIVSSFAFFLGVAVETEAARFGAASSSILIGSS